MTEQEYRSAEGVNKSTLWNMMKSPAHYKYCLENEQEDRPEFKFGRAVHSAILTPDEYLSDYIVMPEGLDKRTRAGKEFIENAEASGKEILTAEDGQKVAEMAESFMRNRDAVALMEGTKREEPMFWVNDNGILCKCRVDAYKAGTIIDLKTAREADTRTFSREALRYGYDVQAAHYIDAYLHLEAPTMPEWYFIAIEKTGPYAINILKADPDFIKYGFDRRYDLMQRLLKCQEEEEFPDYGVNDLFLPSWNGL